MSWSNWALESSTKNRKRWSSAINSALAALKYFIINSSLMKHVYFILPDCEPERKVTLNGIGTPAGPTYLFTYAKNIGFGNYESGECIDFSIRDPYKTLQLIDDSDLVCLTATVSNYKNVVAFGSMSKSRGAKVAVGGPWATAKAVQIKKKQQWIDLNTTLVTFGQNICVPVSPFCSRCLVFKFCKRVAVISSR